MGDEGDDGDDGAAIGGLASRGTDLTVRNGVYTLDSPADGIGLLGDDASIDSNFGIFFGVRAVAKGSVLSGGRDVVGDPRLVDPSDDDYRPGPGSPAIDAGDNGFLPAIIGVDLGGEPRPTDDPASADTGSGSPPIVDLGAFEFQPPSCATSPEELWPPNHKYVDVAVDIDLGTTGDVDHALRVWASSDEPDNDIGDGNTTGDVNGSDGFGAPVDVTAEFAANGDAHAHGTLALRAERQGPGDGREYTISVEVDADGASTSVVSCVVRVPHDQGGD
jgi:hypothetical protein